MGNLAEPVLLRFDGFAMDLTRRVLLRGETPVALRPRSFELLACLARNAGRVVTKDELMAAVWPGVVVTDESLARCVSDIRAALGDGAQHLVKTVPRRGYVFAAPTRHGGAAAKPHRRWKTWMPAAVALLLVLGAGLWATGWHGGVGVPPLSIVVLPLASRNGDPQQAYLAEAVTQEITVDLSRIPDSFVIGRSTADSYRGRSVDARQVGRDLGVRYVLEGVVDRVGDDVRLSLQLVDAQSGRALWAERFDGELRDLSGLHRRVTGTIAQSLRLRLVEAEWRRSWQRPAADLTAHDLALQAWSLLQRRTPQDISAARGLLQRAVERDRDSAFAWSLMAYTYAAEVGSRHLSVTPATRSEWLRLGEQAADRAYMLDPNHPSVLEARAWILSLQGRGEEALAVVERHLAINRNDATAWFRLCHTNTTLGRQAEAITGCREAIRLSPRDALLGRFYVVLAAAHLHLGEDEQALQWAQRSALEEPWFSVAHSWVASAAANAGHMEMARSALAEFRRLRPDYTVASFRAEKLCANTVCEQQRERYYSGLKKAGLPE